MKDSIAVTVFLFTLWNLASLTGIDIAGLQSMCGLFMGRERVISMLTFVPVYSFTGYFLSKSLLNLWSGDEGKKILFFGIIFFLIDLVITVSIFQTLNGSLVAALAEKMLFGAILRLFTVIREKETTTVMKNIRISEAKITKCR